MNCQIRASSIANKDVIVHIKQSDIILGTTIETSQALPNTGELFLSSFLACILKNLERFSGIMKYTYRNADIIIQAVRLESPPRMGSSIYDLNIYSGDKKLNTSLLQKNIENHGTIYDTVALSCSILGTISKITDV